MPVPVTKGFTTLKRLKKGKAEVKHLGSLGRNGARPNLPFREGHLGEDKRQAENQIEAVLSRALIRLGMDVYPCKGGVCALV